MLDKIELFVTTLPFWIQFAAQLLAGLTVVATVIVRVTPKPGDDEAVGKFTEGFLKVLHWLPTIGINPQTKKLEEALKDLKK
jgi:hypothetical protein